MRRITLVLMVAALMTALMVISALSGIAQVLDPGGGQYEDPGQGDTALDTGGGQYEDPGQGDTALDTGGGQYEDPTQGDGTAPGDSNPPAEAAPLCAPEWLMEWHQWWGREGGWWYYWWYKWCYTSKDGWYRDYNSWAWGPPIAS